MTPQEKADELFKAYLNVGMGNGWAKQCALIVADEVIANIEPSVSMDVITARIKYWQEVKNEIEKL
jgi:hypothetical protein